MTARVSAAGISVMFLMRLSKALRVLRYDVHRLQRWPLFSSDIMRRSHSAWRMVECTMSRYATHSVPVVYAYGSS